jgi:anti-sigma B factor antagonist
VGGETLEVEELADCRFAVRGHLDLDTVPVLRNALRRAIEPGATIDLDFSEVTFLDSSGLQALVSMASDVAPGRVNVVGVSGGPLNVLSLTGLLDIKGLHVVPLEG